MTGITNVRARFHTIDEVGLDQLEEILPNPRVAKPKVSEASAGPRPILAGFRHTTHRGRRVIRDLSGARGG